MIKTGFISHSPPHVNHLQVQVLSEKNKMRVHELYHLYTCWPYYFLYLHALEPYQTLWSKTLYDHVRRQTNQNEYIKRSDTQM